MINLTRSVLLFSFVLACTFESPAAKKTVYSIGVARMDVTPDYPVRMSGYLARKSESTGAVHRIWAKALAIGGDREGPAILITVDNCGIPAWMRDEVAGRLNKKAKIASERLAICASHTHSAPYLDGMLPTLFGEPIPDEHMPNIRRYTRELTDALEKVALAALKNRQPGTLGWSQGKAGFANNRRTKGGPVDHDVPMLAARDGKGKLRAVLANYACHCTTLGSDFKQICGDWAGFAQDYIEENHPGVTALIAIGCGADSNPQPRPGLDLARQHGREIADEVKRLLERTLTPVRGKVEARAKQIELRFDTPPTRAEWEEKAKQETPTGYYARHNLAKLDRGETISDKLLYLVQTWNFGSDLAMVFLPGEVVVDYSLRLKKEFDAARLWVNAYANDVPCYIPSERVLNEGGYEGGGAMIYYDRPNKFAPGVEGLIINAVHELMPKDFVFDLKKAESPPPLSPEDSLATMQTRAGLKIELVAAEPMVIDPVAIDWGADGKLWVVEMFDYPCGVDGNWKPGGRIRVLEDTNRDGKYDKATLFLDGIPFPTGVTAWRKGALICAAPDILYAEDTNGDGKANVVKKIFTGFVTENYHARVNSLALGLDNWIYGANGLLGGVIRGEAAGKEVDIRGRDFRMNPDTGVFEPASGLTQQGRARDDWGNWFGCDNSTLAWHFPLPDHYLRRNPHVPAPNPRVLVGSGPDPNLLHPISRTLERFNNPQAANRATSVCGLGIHRDDLLGADLNGDIFTCENVHNLVRRFVPQPEGVTIRGVRAADEQTREFLAARDNWFRPVQVRTGPDGALWIVDMYRGVIEHPRWIPAERLATLDVRAGDDMGRIYRIVPADKKPRPIQNLRKLSTTKLVAALNTPNGTTRDLVHLELTQRGDKAAIRPLEELAGKSSLPAVRLQALCVLDGLNALKPELIIQVLTDAHPAVRANAIRLSEPFLQVGRGVPTAPPDGSLRTTSPTLLAALLKLIDDPELTVRYQLALSLGEWADPRAAEALGKLAARDMGDSWMRAAILSSAKHHSTEILKVVFASNPEAAGRGEMISQLVATAVGESKPESLAQIIPLIAPVEPADRKPWQLAALGSLMDALDRKGSSLAALGKNAALRDSLHQLDRALEWARQLASESETPDTIREPAVRLLGRHPAQQAGDVQLLIQLLSPPASKRVQTAALDTLKRVRNPQVAGLLLSDWKLRPPSLRQSILEILFSRDEWTAELLTAIESGVVGQKEISLENRQRLLTHKKLQSRAQALFGSATSDRADVLAWYQTVATLSGDPAKGAEIFTRSCVACHVFRRQGHNVGPRLDGLIDKTSADWLLAILDPNAVIEPRFVAYNIETKDDRSLSGIVSAETATTLTLVQGGGVQEKILRSDIAEIRASTVSLMPEGLEQNIPPQEMADLIAYLRTGIAPFGGATAEQAGAARKKFIEGGLNGLAKIVSAFDQLPYPSWMGHLPLPYCRQTAGNSKLVWETAPAPAGLKPDAMHEFRLPAGMGYLSNPAGKFSLRFNGKAVIDFNVVLYDKTWESKDGKIRMSYTVMENNSEDSNGILLISVAGALLEPGKPAKFEVAGSPANSQRWFGIYQLPAEETAAASATARNLSLTEKILSDATPTAEREAIINSNPQLSALFLKELIRGLPAGTPEEYRRIPWIWRVTVAAGKRNDAEEIVRILEVSLPKPNESLLDWQAVVVGGGIINGIGLVGHWPKERVESILKDKPGLLARWHRANDLAFAMADDEKVKPGTRYDALRMIAMDSWEKRGAQLVKYLAKGVSADLQQGAISGLSDMKSPHVSPALISGLGHYSTHNRELALDALLRDEQRIGALRDELAAGRITRADLGEKRIGQVRQ